MHRRIVTYAQNREDLILSGFFDENETGFYVDVGANEPTHESVTKIFYDKGWNGINIEPIPTLHEKLEKARPRDTNLAIGVGAKKGSATLHYYPNGDGLSTVSEVMADQYKNAPSVFTRQEQAIKIPILTLSEVLSTYASNQPISFMKVDVEGYEYEALIGNDWDRFRPEVICIEANHIEKDWRTVLETNHYSLVFFDGLNNYYTDDKTDRAQKFDYIQAIIFKEPITNFRLLEDFKEYDEVVAWLETTVSTLRTENEAARAQLQKLQNMLDQITPLRRHIKTQLRQQFRKIDKKISQKLARQNNFQPIDSELSAHGTLLEAVKTSDRVNFDLYTTKQKPHILYPVYDVSKRAVYKTARKTQSILRKGSKA